MVIGSHQKFIVSDIILRSDFITRYQVIKSKLAPLITLDLTHKDVVTINVTRNLTSDLYYYNLGF